MYVSFFVKNTNKIQNNRLSTMKKRVIIAQIQHYSDRSQNNQDKIRIIRRKEENKDIFKKSEKIEESSIAAKPPISFCFHFVVLVRIRFNRTKINQNEIIICYN